MSVFLVLFMNGVCKPREMLPHLCTQKRPGWGWVAQCTSQDAGGADIILAQWYHGCTWDASVFACVLVKCFFCKKLLFWNVYLWTAYFCEMFSCVLEMFTCTYEMLFLWNVFFWNAMLTFVTCLLVYLWNLYLWNPYLCTCELLTCEMFTCEMLTCVYLWTFTCEMFTFVKVSIWHRRFLYSKKLLVKRY